MHLRNIMVYSVLHLFFSLPFSAEIQIFTSGLLVLTVVCLVMDICLASSRWISTSDNPAETPLLAAHPLRCFGGWVRCSLAIRACNETDISSVVAILT